MEAHVTPDELQISQVYKSMGYKATRVAHVTIRGSEPMKSAAVRGEVGRNCVIAWGHVHCSMQTELLGFSRRRSWVTSVWCWFHQAKLGVA